MANVNVFRGNGVFVKGEGRGYGTIHNFVTPETVRVRFRSGFDEVAIADLLPVSNLESLVTVAHRYHEDNLELDFSPRNRDDQLEAELSDEELAEQKDEEIQEAEFAEEIED